MLRAPEKFMRDDGLGTKVSSGAASEIVGERLGVGVTRDLVVFDDATSSSSSPHTRLKIQPNIPFDVVDCGTFVCFLQVMIGWQEEALCGGQQNFKKLVFKFLKK
jgi:hypothetical protein